MKLSKFAIVNIVKENGPQINVLAEYRYLGGARAL
jgi:hypothetical protein